MKSHILTRAAVGAAASLAVIAPLAGCSSDGGSTSAQSPAPSTSSAAPTPEETMTETASPYADGTYTARGVYGGAPSHMDFTVTLEDGVITDVKSELMADNNDTSRGYQERFAAALPDEVEGKPIDGLQVGVIAGASGCADGFNDALTKIREQASTSN